MIMKMNMMILKKMMKMMISSQTAAFLSFIDRFDGVECSRRRDYDPRMIRMQRTLEARQGFSVAQEGGQTRQVVG